MRLYAHFGRNMKDIESANFILKNLDMVKKVECTH